MFQFTSYFRYYTAILDFFIAIIASHGTSFQVWSSIAPFFCWRPTRIFFCSNILFCQFINVSFGLIPSYLLYHFSSYSNCIVWIIVISYCQCYTRIAGDILVLYSTYRSVNKNCSIFDIYPCWRNLRRSVFHKCGHKDQIPFLE